MSSSRRWASGGIVGAFALMCACPALVLGRDSGNTDIAAASAAAGAISQALGAPTRSRGEMASKGDQAAQHDKKDKDDSAGDRHGRRPFTEPPGHQGTPARDFAPGHVRSQTPQPVAEDPPPAPSGAVLGATPRSVNQPRVPARGRSPRIPDSASHGTPDTIGGDVQPPLSAAITSGPRSAVAFGGVLGVAAALNPAYGDLGTPSEQNGLAAALLLIVVGAQAIAGALVLSAARDMLGGIGRPLG